jgi:hypothetical protein|tara:strand:+ start:270 stop:389 length:120 start_codon:yes stop_codon:yes gene_type:complete
MLFLECFQPFKGMGLGQHKPVVPLKGENANNFNLKINQG